MASLQVTAWTGLAAVSECPYRVINPQDCRSLGTSVTLNGVHRWNNTPCPALGKKFLADVVTGGALSNEMPISPLDLIKGIPVFIGHQLYAEVSCSV